MALALAFALLAFGIRMMALGDRPLWLDEAYSAWFSARSWQELWTTVPTYETHPPLYYSLLKLWSTVAGSSPAALRGLSVLLGAASVLIAAAAALELDRRDRVHRPRLRVGIVAFLCACSPMFIFLDQQARPYAFMIFAYSLSTLALVRLIGELRGGPGTARSWALLAAGTELTLWSHSLGALYAISLAVALVPAWLRVPLDPERMRRGIAAAAMVAVAYIPCLLMIGGRAGDWQTTWIAWDNRDLIVLLVLCVAPVGDLGIASIAAALVLAFLLKRLLQTTWAQGTWTADRALLILWWGPPLMSAAISLLYAPVFLPRTLAAAMVPAYLALAGALVRTDSLRERAVLVAGLATLLPAAVLETRIPASERWDAVASYLSQNVAAGDEIWLYPNDSALPIAANRPGAHFPLRGIPSDYPAVGVKGPIRAGSPAVVSVTQSQAEAIGRRAALEPERTIWLVTRQSGIFDPDNDLPRALAENRRPGKAQRWGYIAVQPFTRR